MTNTTPGAPQGERLSHGGLVRIRLADRSAHQRLIGKGCQQEKGPAPATY